MVDTVKAESFSLAGDSRYDFLRECFRNVVSGLESMETRLDADRESFHKSMKERLKEIEQKEKALEEKRLIQEEAYRHLDLRKKELGSIAENLTEKKKSIEVEKEKLQSMKIGVSERLLKVSMREKILDLKREELSAKEEELYAKEKILVEKEKVLGSRNEQLLARAKQMEIRETLLNLQDEEMEEVKDIKLVEDAAPPDENEEEYRDSRNRNRKRGEIDAEKQIILQVDESAPSEETLSTEKEKLDIPRNGYNRIRFSLKKLKVEK